MSTFQSTRPLRGATGGGRPAGGQLRISIHAPLTGRDGSGIVEILLHIEFQSTRPLRGATFHLPDGQTMTAISIHAPLTGRDFGTFLTILGQYDFNPRAPYGARLTIRQAAAAADKFQSTRPLRGATYCNIIWLQRQVFQSTRPLRGATPPPTWRKPSERDFNPRAPYGARPNQRPKADEMTGFQSTRPLRGATGLPWKSPAHA